MRTLLIIIVFLSISFDSSCQIPKKAQKRIDSLFNDISKIKQPGYAVGIIKDKKLIFGKGYGYANLEHNILITTTSNFNIASLSKQFTGACIALLILRKQISLDDDIRQYLPDFPQYSDTIRIKHLIYMTSGIKEYFTTKRNNGTDWSGFNYFTIDTAIEASAKIKALEFHPATKWSYSNINYMLLTKIVEKVTGKTFAEFAEENVFRPLEMTNTVVNDDITAIIPNRVSAYFVRNKETINEFASYGYKISDKGDFVQINRNSPHYGGSGVFASIEDLAKWDANFYTNKLAGSEFTKLMHKRIKFEHSKDNDAFGLVYGTYKNQETVWYEGGDAGVSTYMIRFPKHKFTVICLSNMSGGNAQNYAMRIIEILEQTKIINFNDRKPKNTEGGN
jgi:CubicO group peptidase (beta-lactamase class C family)